VWGDRIYVTSAVSSAGEELLKVGSGREARIASATDVGPQEWHLGAAVAPEGAAPVRRPLCDSMAFNIGHTELRTSR